VNYEELKALNTKWNVNVLGESTLSCEG